MQHAKEWQNLLLSCQSMKSLVTVFIQMCSLMYVLIATVVTCLGPLTGGVCATSGVAAPSVVQASPMSVRIAVRGCYLAACSGSDVELPRRGSSSRPVRPTSSRLFALEADSLVVMIGDGPSPTPEAWLGYRAAGVRHIDISAPGTTLTGFGPGMKQCRRANSRGGDGGGG